MAVAHVVGGLTLDEGRLFRSHLLECTACRARVGELRAIAHDLADVERDERRERAAKRTETKERLDDAAEAAPPTSRRLRVRPTLLVGLGLVLLMVLSSWNFVLRSRLEQSDEVMSLQRRAVRVLQEGTRWRVLTPSEDDIANRTTSVDGQVTTLDGDLVVMVDGLTDAAYGIYLLDGNGAPIGSEPAEAANGTVLAYLSEVRRLGDVRQLLLVRSEDLMPQPRGQTVFAAEPPTTDEEAGTEPDPPQQFEPVGADGD